MISDLRFKISTLRLYKALGQIRQMSNTDIYHNQNPTFLKSLELSIRIVNLYKYLKEKKGEYVLSKQIVRSGTSIGANISEAISAESPQDFIHKLQIALKETNETLYWLILLHKTEYITDCEYQSIAPQAEELRKIIVSIILTSKNNLKNKRKKIDDSMQI